LFDVTATNQSLYKAIQIRLHTGTEQARLTPAQHRHNLSHTLQGFRIKNYIRGQPTNQSDEMGSVVNRLWLLEQEPNDAFVKLVNQDGKLCAYATPNTREGDWYLKSSWEGTDLIARSSESSKCILIGVALLLEGCTVHMGNLWSTFWGAKVDDSVAIFQLIWHSEDLLVLEWLLRNARPSNHELLNMQICGVEGSSYAILSRGPRMTDLSPGQGAASRKTTLYHFGNAIDFRF
jgi:hypothetical protein